MVIKIDPSGPDERAGAADSTDGRAGWHSDVKSANQRLTRLLESLLSENAGTPPVGVPTVSKQSLQSVTSTEVTRMKLKPLGDRLIVRAIEEEEKTASGLVLPDTAKEKPQKGEVLAVGDGRFDEDGEKRIPLDVSKGDTVLYSKYGGTEIKVDGEDLLVLRESDVLAKIEN
jgi:chaperonin GroES